MIKKGVGMMRKKVKLAILALSLSTNVLGGDYCLCGV